MFSVECYRVGLQSSYVNTQLTEANYKDLLKYN